MYIGYNPIEPGLFFFPNSSYTFIGRFSWLTLQLLVRNSMCRALNVDIKQPLTQRENRYKLMMGANSGHYYFDDSRLHNDRSTGCFGSFYHYCPVVSPALLRFLLKCFSSLRPLHLQLYISILFLASLIRYFNRFIGTRNTYW